MRPPHPIVRADRPLVFAHRGGAALSPENTIEAFDRGLALGADGLELDVRLTCDGRVVALHDRRLDRTTNARGCVADRLAADLAAIDAGYRFERHGEFPFRDRGVRIPALDEILARYREAFLIIELKVADAGLARAVVEAVGAAEAWDRVCLGAFDLPTLMAARALDPRPATSAAAAEVQVALAELAWGRPISDAPYKVFQVPEIARRTRIVTPEFVRAAHAAGLLVQVWTVDRADEVRRLLDWGVDGIITDRPDVVVPTVREWVSERTR